MPDTRAVLLLLAGLATGAVTAPLDAQRNRPRSDRDTGPHYTIPRDTALYMAILEAEDARGSSQAAMSAILAGLRHDEVPMRIAAARALGRLERSNLVPSLVPLVADPDPDVRAEAVNAVGQSVFRQNTELATRTLVTRLEYETDPVVQGVLIETLGRLPFQSRDRRDLAGHTMLRVSPTVGAAGMHGVARGWNSFVRRLARSYPLPPAAHAYLRELAAYRPAPGAPRAEALRQDAAAPAVRQLGVATAILAGAADSALLAAALADSAWAVRREAAVGLRTIDSLDGRDGLVRRTLTDEHFSVRLEGLLAYDRHLRANAGCDPILTAERDPSPHVALAAIDALARCGDAGVDRLVAIAREAWTPLDWHRPAHALVALARANADPARTLLPGFASSEVTWVRVYAARAAQILEAEGMLARLAGDPETNVREAAVAGLSAVSGHAADERYLAALETHDYNLVITVAAALEGSPHPQAVPRMLQWLGVLTAAGRQTSRDARRALVARIGELGSAAQTEALRPYLRDYDAVIARDVAAVLTGWNGTTYDATPEPLPDAPFPTLDDLRRADAPAEIRLQMRRGGEIVLRTFSTEAPTNVMRFYRLALARYFDGLTFHRVVPNFVIQGGSPGANEYVGDGPFTRDEVGRRSHTRGTVGISTRGRDTGDAQIFINLVDNPRLDHDYTLVAEVVEGMDTVDAVLEGDVIERVRIRFR